MGHRLAYTNSALIEFLQSLDVVEFSADIYDEIEKQPPIIGAALSGGGYRSMLISAGFLQEMHEWRLFDSLTYISGLSGGSWTLMDLIVHDFEPNRMIVDWNLGDGLLQGIPEFDVKHKDLVSGMEEADLPEEVLDKRELDESMNSNFVEFQKALDIETAFLNESDEEQSLRKRGFNPLAKLREAIFQASEEVSIAESEPVKDRDGKMSISSWRSLKQVIQFYIDLHMEVRPKKVQGFPVSFTDYLGKAFVKSLGEAIQNKSVTSLSRMLSDSQSFREFRAPIPIFVANCKNNYLKNVIFEFSPFEFGSWDPLLRLFVKLKYLGSEIREGIAQRCIVGFDDLGFITATSSSIFNNVLLYIWEMTAKSSKETIRAVKAIMGLFGLRSAENDPRPADLTKVKADFAVYHPNPFLDYPTVDSILTADDHLYLVDGGEDGENIPLRPLMIPERGLDAIFILDSSSDVENYPDGRKLQNVMRQVFPDSNWSFPNLTLPLRKLLAFGCYDVDIPVLLYYVNAKHNYQSNTSTFKITYNEAEIAGMLKNGRDVFSSSSSDRYRSCIGCLLLKRTIERLEGFPYPDFCQECYEEYCY